VTQARRTSGAQKGLRPMRIGAGTLPQTSQARQVRGETLHSAAAIGAVRSSGVAWADCATDDAAELLP
jgi:hypothetical protein